VLVPQPVLVEQLPLLLQGVRVEGAVLENLRVALLRQHEERSGEEAGRRGRLNAEYEQVTKEIGAVFSQRKEAEAMGILGEVDGRLGELRRRRDELQAKLNAGHEKGSAWIEKVIRSFELIGLVQEAIFFASARPREMMLTSIASHYSLEGQKLVWKPRSPFREAEQRSSRPEWWAGLNDVRTEIAETFNRLEADWSLLQAP
jgi:hypothetical protein